MRTRMHGRAPCVTAPCGYRDRCGCPVQACTAGGAPTEVAPASEPCRPRPASAAPARDTGPSRDSWVTSVPPVGIEASNGGAAARVSPRARASPWLRSERVKESTHARPRTHGAAVQAGWRRNPSVFTAVWAHLPECTPYKFPSRASAGASASTSSARTHLVLSASPLLTQRRTESAAPWAAR
jgi:hypothetical protein